MNEQGPAPDAKQAETQTDSRHDCETDEIDSDKSIEIEEGDDDAATSETKHGSEPVLVSPEEILTPIADEQAVPDAPLTLDMTENAPPQVTLPGAPSLDAKHSEQKPDLPDIAIARAAAISRPGALRTGDAGSDPTLAVGEEGEAEGAIPAAKFDAPAAPTQAASELSAEMPEAPAADSKPSDIAKILKPETPVEKPDAPTAPLPDKVTAAPPISSNRPSTDIPAIEKGKPDEPNEKAAETPARETVAANRTEHPLPAQAQNQTVKPDNAQAVGFTLASNLPALDIQRLDLAPQTPLQAALMQSDDPAVPIQGLAVEFAARALAGKNRYEIRLDPPELGRIDVRLEVDSEGNVQSRMVVERIETLDLLRRDAPQLERALQQAGLKTGENGLEFSLRDHSLPQRERFPNEQPRLFIPDEDLGPVDVARNYGRMIGLGSGIDIRV